MTGAVFKGLPELRDIRDAGGFQAIRGALAHRAGAGDPIASEAREEARRIGHGDPVELRVEQVAVERDDRVDLGRAGERDEVVVVGGAHMAASVVLRVGTVFALSRERGDVCGAAFAAGPLLELWPREHFA